MVDPHDDPKTTAAMCDAIDGVGPVTTSEQQAVPVAQELDETTPGFLIDLASRIHAKATPAMGFDGYDVDRLIEIARSLAEPASLPCKSGEGAGLPDVRLALAHVGQFPASYAKHMKPEDQWSIAMIEKAFALLYGKEPTPSEQFAKSSPDAEAIGNAILTADTSNPVWRGLLLDAILAATSSPDAAGSGGEARNDFMRPDETAIEYAKRISEPRPDATQTREAELVAAIEAEIGKLKGADSSWAIGIRTRLRAALNARGGA